MGKNRKNKQKNVNTENKTNDLSKENIENNEQVKNIVSLKDVWLKLQPEKQIPALNTLLLSSENILKQSIMKLIDQAERKICISSFLFNDNDIVDKLIEKAKQNIDIYILTASEAILNKQTNEDYDRHNAHVKLLKQISAEYRIVVRTGNIHAKFIIIDDKEGLLSTSNFNKEPLTRDGEVGIKIKNNDIYALNNLFIKTFWEKSDSELSINGKSLKQIEKKKTTIDLLKYNLLFTYDKTCNTIKEQVIKNMREAKETIKITSFNYNYGAIEDILLEKANSGINIQIIGRERKILQSKIYERLKKYHNVIFYTNEHIHAKLLICDEKALLLTANYEEKGMDEGVEVGIIIDNNEAEKVFTFYKQLSKFRYYIEKKYEDIIKDELWKSSKDKIENIKITNDNNRSQDDKKLKNKVKNNRK